MRVSEHVRYVYRVHVTSVEELKRRINWRKNDHGQAEYDEEGLGVWIVRLADGASLHLPEEPIGFTPGKTVKMTVETEHEVQADAE